MLLKLLRNRKINKKGLIPSVITSILLLALSVSAFINRQQIVDQISVWQYQPSDEIIQLANRSGMSETGKFVFYASQPEIDATQSFNEVCARFESTVSILGCYDGLNIYLYDITNEELDGVMEVTAAHEMLHAAYKRLSDSSRQIIDSLLEVEYEKLSQDKDFTDLIEYYKKTEPGERSNELHSIIGTEITDISSELERHYSRYFSERQKVVELNAKYSSRFDILKNRSDILYTQLKELGDSLSTRRTTYDTLKTELDHDINKFKSEQQSGEIISQFEVNRLQARILEFNSLVQSINNDIKKYLMLKEEYDLINIKYKTLQDSIDSTLAPAPSL